MVPGHGSATVSNICSSGKHPGRCGGRVGDHPAMVHAGTDTAGTRWAPATRQSVKRSDFMLLRWVGSPLKRTTNR